MHRIGEALTLGAAPAQEDLFGLPEQPPAAHSVSLFERLALALSNSTHPYAQKDLAKARTATKFIGRGSAASSTNKYRLAAGDLANCGAYAFNDVVFVSAEGARGQRLPVDVAELKRAVQAGAVFITDTLADRSRPYNVGEREVAAFLTAQGYRDNGQGRWSP